MAKILITGTSKGIGYDASLQLARGGHEVVATMRNPNVSKLAEVAAKESLPIDIQVLDSIQKVTATLIRFLMNCYRNGTGASTLPASLKLCDI